MDTLLGQYKSVTLCLKLHISLSSAEWHLERDVNLYRVTEQ